MRILIIDDEECIRDSISIFLSERGYEVETASSPLRGRDVVKNGCGCGTDCADIILIDYLMPEMTGLDYLEKREGWGCRAPKQHIALMSGFLSESLKHRAHNLGCEVFEKPVRLDAIETWLSGLPSPG